MSRPFAVVTLGLAASVSFLAGLIVAGSVAPASVRSELTGPAALPVPSVVSAPAPPLGASFADIAALINPSVVNISATARLRTARTPLEPPGPRRWVEPPLDDDPGGPRWGSGSGFIIDADGFILTNYHVIEQAERVTVKLADGRSLRATVVGTDPPTDIALLKVDAGGPLPAAPLGDSSELRVGDWVCAIGNPLGYEHTVTVGVVSYLGRKLFDASLDDYIQTDAAIHFGNSGGPLINTRGQVIGINSAISRRASNIGFAIPINQARAILPQLRAQGRVSRGYIGVTLKDVDPDLKRSLKLPTSRGALVEDVAPGSPGARAGLRPYDLVVAVDGREVVTNTDLIRRIAARRPGTLARLTVWRDGRERSVLVKLAERPRPLADPGHGLSSLPAAPRPDEAAATIGLTVRPLDSDARRRFGVPETVGSGVVVVRVEPASPAFDAGIERGFVVLEINRRPVASVAEYERLIERARPGDVLALFVYMPSLGQRGLRTVRVETP
jgi:serine protease Do